MAHRTPSGERPRGERGYSLAALVGILAVLAIVLTAALPLWAARVQRGREAELVARGLQYAEALRVFQRRFGRLPNRLAELVELEPRSIRRLWTNPMARDGDGWLVLMEGPGGALLPVDPATGEVVAVGAGETAGNAAQSAAGAAAPAGVAPGTAVAGPIHGVRSRVRGKAYLHFFDQQDYGDWEFTLEGWVAATGALAPDGLPRRTGYATIGRPFRYPPPGGSAGAGALGDAAEAPPAGGASDR